MNLSKRVPVSFQSERFLMRRYEIQDAEKLYEAARASIPEVFRFLPWCHPDYSLDDSTGWIDLVLKNWKEGNGYSFGIFSPDGSEFHGGCGINRIDEHPVANLGYWIKTTSMGQGVATESTRALAHFVFQHLGIKRLEIMMSVQNPASRLVAEKSGAVFEGTLRNRISLHGDLHDAHLYSLVPADLAD